LKHLTLLPTFRFDASPSATRKADKFVLEKHFASFCRLKLHLEKLAVMLARVSSLLMREAAVALQFDDRILISRQMGKALPRRGSIRLEQELRRKSAKRIPSIL
jgi:hypothetical protein